MPSFVEFSPLGDFTFVTATGSNLIEVRDTYTKGFITSLTDAGIAPRATVLGPQNRPGLVRKFWRRWTRRSGRLRRL